MQDCTDIKDIRPGLRNLKVKFIVLEVGEAFLTKRKHNIRIFKVADQTACINAAIWNEFGELIQAGDIIKLSGAYALLWRRCLTLYSCKNGNVCKVDEFCMIFDEQIDMSDPARFENYYVFRNPAAVVSGQTVDEGNIETSDS